MRNFIALVLGVMLTGFTSMAWANPKDVPAPPMSTIPLDEEDEVTLQAEVTKQVLTFLQTMQAH